MAALIGGAVALAATFVAWVYLFGPWRNARMNAGLTTPLSPVLERLSRVVDAGITDQERQILRWVSASVPQRLIAEWLGITHNAARVRVLRLRERLIDLALHADTAWSPRERQELYEFFRRAGLSERARRALEGRSGESERGRPRAGPKLPEDDL